MSRGRGSTIVAIVDDHPSRDTLSRALWLSGCRTLLFRSWDEAEDYFQNKPELSLKTVRCILSSTDLMTSGSPRTLHSQLESIPVVLLGMESDLGDSVSKPFREQELMDAITVNLGQQIGKARFQSVKDEDHRLWLEVDVPTTQFYLDRFQQYCSGLIAERAASSAKDEFKIAVQELGQNAIEWGHGFRENMRLRLAYSFPGDRILIRITDQGDGFDHSNLPDTSDPIALIEAREQSGKRPGGFGVQLSRKVMDSITYNAKGNVVTLEKQFTSPQQ
ncbi:MAG: ATP-binding protein [Planctomycetota bacterium]|nr:ATP-binding protein [Planctomycetota bacterium]